MRIPPLGYILIPHSSFSLFLINFTYDKMNREYKSYSVTIRPKDGITAEHISKYQKWVMKKSTYSYTVTEKELHEKHIHSAIFFEKAQRIDNIKRSIINLFSFSASEKHFAVCVKPMYNHDWLSYCNKGDATDVIHSNLPEANMLDHFFPVSNPERSAKTSTKLSFYAKLEKLWYELQSPADEMNPANCRNFLFRLMYKDRLIEPLRDDRTIIQVSRHLSRYLNKMEESCIDVNTLYEKDE